MIQYAIFRFRLLSMRVHRRQNPPSKHTHIQWVHSGLIIRSGPTWCLVSGGGDRGDNGTQRKETKAQLTPFSPSCVRLSLGIVRLSAALQSTHLEKETNPILPADIKPFAPLFSPLVFLYFCLLSVGIFQAPGPLFSIKKNGCVCARVRVYVCVY